MKRNQVQHIRIHYVPSTYRETVIQRASRYHIQFIERKLENTNLTPQQKSAVIARIKQNILAEPK